MAHQSAPVEPGTHARGTARSYLGDVAGWIIVVLGVFAIMVDLLPVY